MKNILITGGSGFLGRQIVSEAENAGYKVFAPRSSEFDLESGKGMDTYFQNVIDKNGEIFCVIHSAAYYGGIGINQSDPVGLIDRNARMALNIFEKAAQFKVKKIVSVGSACSYPGHISDELYERDLFNGRCHDSVESYGFTKRIHLVLQSAYYKQYGIESNQLVLTNLYGEHDVFNEKRSHVISALIKKIVEAKQNAGFVNAWGTGKPIREFVYVKDAARVIVESIKFEHDLEPINVDGEDTSIFDLSNLIAELAGLDTSMIKWDSTKPDGVYRKVLNGDKIRGVMPDYKPLSLREGLEKTINWYMENKEEADKRE
jgi:GDP-L-fucose synthase